MQDLIDFFQANSALGWTPIASRRSAAGLLSRKCARSRPFGFDAKADHRGRGQSVPRPVLRPALC